MNKLAKIKISDYTYELPDERIAKFPLQERDKSKLLVYRDGEVNDYTFFQSPELIPSETTLVFNNTRVVQARLLFEKTSGAKPIEIFCLEPFEVDVQQAMITRGVIMYHCMVGNAKRWNEGLILSKTIMKAKQKIEIRAELLKKQGHSFLILFRWDSNISFAELLELAGRIPLPPYLNRDSTPEDAKSYQTVYAKYDGSVAAPTAGLHFTSHVMNQLKAKGVKLLETTLHVGAGTFKPIQTDDVSEHTIHHEEIHVSISFLRELKNAKGQIIAVGTTSTRTLESLYWLGVKCISTPHLFEENPVLMQWDAYQLPQNTPWNEAIEALEKHMERKGMAHFFTYTQLIIVPGYLFRMIDGMFTNFHQPGSTLILLVAAAVGQHWRNIYNHSLSHGYRFLSYGDSSLLFISSENKSGR